MQAKNIQLGRDLVVQDMRLAGSRAVRHPGRTQRLDEHTGYEVQAQTARYPNEFQQLAVTA